MALLKKKKKCLLQICFHKLLLYRIFSILFFYEIFHTTCKILLYLNYINERCYINMLNLPFHKRHCIKIMYIFSILLMAIYPRFCYHNCTIHLKCLLYKLWGNKWRPKIHRTRIKTHY